MDLVFFMKIWLVSLHFILHEKVGMLSLILTYSYDNLNVT